MKKKDEILLWKCLKQLLRNQIRLMIWTTENTKLQQNEVEKSSKLKEDCQSIIDTLENSK